MAIERGENTVVAERYRLTRVIARGGMGTVWQATNLRLDVPCAIKFIEGDLARDAVALGRFEREAKAAAQIRSPHVVQILDHGTFDGAPYIAMELLDGEDLGRRLSRAFRMSPRDVAAVVTQASRALAKAHAMEIVHRDLKPENLFLAWDDDREIVKVLDFGVAKRVQLDLPSHTTQGAMLGTPSYMSPEQAQGAKDVDYRSDLWALAVIAFRCMTGVLPFRSKSLAELLVQIIVGPLPVPSELAIDVPSGFDAWWARAASRDPNRRFQSAKELAHALVECLGLPPFSDGLERRMRPSPALPDAVPRGLPPAAFAPPPAVPVGASAGAIVPSRNVEVGARMEPEKRSSGSALVATGIALVAIGAIAAVMLSRPRGEHAAAAARAGAPVVPEVVEEEEEEAVPAATRTPSPPPPDDSAPAGERRRPAPHP